MTSVDTNCGVVYNFGPVWYISREYGSSSYMKVISHAVKRTKT